MKDTLRFGLCSDVHYGTMPNEFERFQQFVDAMNKENLDFVISLGDFCPINKNSDLFFSLWEKIDGLRYHILGNHDMDRNTKKEAVEYLKMKAPYYSFDCENYHFVVLDTNSIKSDNEYVDYDNGNYYRCPDKIDWIAEEQLLWLEKDLKQTNKKSILFSHQYLGDKVFGIHNADAVTKIIQEARDEQDNRKVIACINGHHHTDGVKILQGVYYIAMNSMSYFYMDPTIDIPRYSQEITDKYPMLRQSAPYKNPLYTIVTLTKDSISCSENISSFVGPSPTESGHIGQLGGHIATARIDEKNLKY